MTGFSTPAAWAILLTFAVYWAAAKLQQRTRCALLNPILVSAAVIGLVLAAGQIPQAQYQQGVQAFTWLLTPATICLALPMYEQLQRLRRDFAAILAGVAGGTAASLGTIFLLCALFGLERTAAVSLLPKSITTAIGMVLSEQAGGLPSVTGAAIIATGILGSVFGRSLCRAFHIVHPTAQGVAFGTASHVIGTSKAAQLSETAGAAGSLSLVLAGVLTAAVLPLLAGQIG